MGLFETAFLSELDKEKIVAAIREAELNTSGEIRLHLEPYCKIEVLDRAADVFGFLEMHKTELRNGVLFYLAYKDHQFAILGDSGVNAKVPPHFWEETRDLVIEKLKNKQTVEGIITGINMAGKLLKTEFPYLKNDKNELSDEISIG
jgi:uncharacterized membrane protein